MSVAEQLDDRWYVQLAALLTLMFAIMHLCKVLNFIFIFIVSVHSFSPFSLLSINSTEWSTIPACPSLMCSFNRSNIEGTLYEKDCV